MSDRTKYLAAVKFLVDDNQKLRQENDRLRSGIELLISDYKSKVEILEKELTRKVDLETFTRLGITHANSKNIISDLQNLLKD